MGKSVLMVVLIAIALIWVAHPVMAAPSIIVDGDLSDWGLSALQTGDWKVEQTWLPSHGIWFLVGNDHNPAHGVLPAGVHIRGTKENYMPYNEPKRQNKYDGKWYSQPFSGEAYDIEAIYFTQDTTKFYVAIVTSLKPNGGGDERPGDLALNLHSGDPTGKPYWGYEYGVKFSSLASPNFPQGAIIKNPVWGSTGYLLPEGADIITAGTNTGKTAAVAYTGTYLAAKPDNGKPNYVIEAAIKKEDVGVSGPISFSSLFYQNNCLNDSIYVPEFPTMAISIGLIFGLIFVIYTMREKNN